MPPAHQGRTVLELAAQRLNLFADGFTTPVLTLDSAALEHNLRTQARWAEEHGFAFAPHGKTTMAPQLFARQLEHGAWGLTAAMPHQVRVYRAFGVRRVFLANELVDRAALEWLARELEADPGFRFVCYVDSFTGAHLMDSALQAAGFAGTVDVVVELGAPGGRTGCRTPVEAFEVARVVCHLPRLNLVGVAGYEGTLAHDAGPESLAKVRDWTRRLVGTAQLIDEELDLNTEEFIVSAGGSAYFDVVAAVLEEGLDLSVPVLKLLRSGAYLGHDDGFYESLTPSGRTGEPRLRPALRLWAQVVSRPESGLALLNAGKRDANQDEGLPVPLAVRTVGGELKVATGLTVTALADQHAFVQMKNTQLAVGDWVCLGLSHPCTVFDRWQLIPEVEDDGTVVDYVRTFF